MNQQTVDRVYVHCLLLTLTAGATYNLQLTTGWRQPQSTHDLAETSPSPGPRTGSSAWMDQKGQAWLFGGRGPGCLETNATTLMSDLWSYDVNNQRWHVRVTDDLRSNSSSSSVQDSLTGREYAAMCGLTNGPVVVFGGRTTDEQQEPVATGQMLIWHQNAHRWETCRSGAILKDGVQPAAAAPSPRYDALVWCNEHAGTMTVVGGYNSAGRRLSDAWTFDLRQLTWKETATPSTDCSWHASTNRPTRNEGEAPKFDSAIGSQVTEMESLELALVWTTSNGTIYIMCDRKQTNGDERLISSSAAAAADDDDPNIQLWRKQLYADQWQLVAESGNGSMTWPGGHKHGVACTDARGNLWLFAGQSRIGGRLYLNNDVWMYNVSSAAWLKVELPADDADEPAKRQRASSWTDGDAMFIYGGSSSCDGDAECIRSDLWVLNMSATRPNANFYPRPALQSITTRTVVTPTVATTLASSPSAVTNGASTPHQWRAHESFTATTSQRPSIIMDTPPVTSPPADITTGANLRMDTAVAGVRHRDQLQQSPPSRNLQVSRVADIPPAVDHGAYGSAIFFGISLSMFAIFGVVLFFRRCVSCPPRDSILLKEPPPVRYTVIPDESYAI